MSSDNLIPKMSVSFKNRDRVIEIGLNIAHYRKRLSMTQDDLAEKANVSRQYIASIEAPNMVPNVSIEILLNIADALNVPIHQMLFFRD